MAWDLTSSWRSPPYEYLWVFWWGVLPLFQREAFQSPGSRALGSLPVHSLYLENKPPNSSQDKEGESPGCQEREKVPRSLPFHWSLFFASYLMSVRLRASPGAHGVSKSWAFWDSVARRGLFLSITLVGICYAIFSALLTSHFPASKTVMRSLICWSLPFSLSLGLYHFYSFILILVRFGKKSRNKRTCSICHL